MLYFPRYFPAGWVIVVQSEKGDVGAGLTFVVDVAPSSGNIVCGFRKNTETVREIQLSTPQ